MKNPWMRFQDIASALGLLLGAIAMLMMGLQINNCWVIILGTASSLFFLLYLGILLYLLFSKDYKKSGKLKRRFLGVVRY